MNTATTENLDGLNLHDFMEKRSNVAALALNGSVQIDNKIDLSATIQAIPAYLDSILLNFVTNGIKYRSNDRLSFIKTYTTIEDQFIVLHIEDNGIGIDLKEP
jgi:signal transduction histidine kinase